jgi:hypothetical protein
LNINPLNTLHKFSYKEQPNNPNPNKQINMEKKKKIKKKCGLLQENIQIATLQAIAQHQSPNSSSKNNCELANNKKPQHIQQQEPLKIPQVYKSAHTSQFSSFTKENESK